MILEVIVTLVAGVAGYAIGAGKSQGSDERERKLNDKYDALWEQRNREQKEAREHLRDRLKYITAKYERDAFWRKVVGRSYFSFTTYAADLKLTQSSSKGYDENAILFPTEADAHVYGRSKISQGVATDYRVTTRSKFPNALVDKDMWRFCGGDNDDVYVEWDGERNWIPRGDHPSAWTVKGHEKFRFRTNDEAHLYSGYLGILAHSYSSADVVAAQGQPNSAFYGDKLETLSGLRA